MTTPAPALALPASWARNSRNPYLEQALAHLAAAVSAGTIPNARFKEATDSVNRALDRAWTEAGDRLRQPWGPDGRSPYPEAIADLFYTHPSLATFARVEKKVAALPPHPLTSAWSDVLAEAKPIAEAWAAAKPLAAKRQVRSAAEREAERYTPPPVASQAQVRVQALLEESVNASYESLYERLLANRQQMLAGFLDLARRSETDPSLRDRWGSYSIYWHFHSDNRHSPDRGDRRGAQELSAWVVPPPHGTTTWKASPKASRLIEAAARKQADDLRRVFVVKNLSKIASILEAKGDARFDEAEVIGMPVSLMSFEGSLRFSFKDGASFRVNNGIVFSRSHLGTPFFRFPLTFHNVILPSGEPMPLPSEERMNTVFARENGPVLPAVARRRTGP